MMTPITAAALVCAGLLSVLIFPVIALGLLRFGPAARGEIPAVSDAPNPHRVVRQRPDPVTGRRPCPNSFPLQDVRLTGAQAIAGARERMVTDKR